MLGNSTEPVVRVEVAEFAPGIIPYLGVVAIAQLALYEAATQAVLGASKLEAKEALAEIAADALAKHQAFVTELSRRGEEPHQVMRPFTNTVNRFRARLAVPDWHQHVLSVWLVGGLFDGFFASLAEGLNDNYRKEAIRVLHDETGRGRLQQLLGQEIAADPRLSDRLALWGRRLVGDTLLLASEVLTLSERREFDPAGMEPIFTEITAEHMRRMDSLGLTA